MPGIGSAGVERSIRTNNRETKKLQALFRSLIGVSVKAVIKEVFPVTVKETVQDSGLAAYNWFIAIGDDSSRLYIESRGLGPVGLSGEHRTSGSIGFNISGSPNAVIGAKIGYMNSLIARANLFNGATLYNQTPESNDLTVKGTYAGNAKIRLALAQGMLNAEAAVEKAAREVGN